MEPLVDITASLTHTRRQFQPDIIKLDEDLARYRAVIETAQPDVIVECGTWRGGSARWFAQWADVVTIDLLPEPAATGGDRIAWLTGNTVDPGIVADVGRRVAGRRTMVVLDSDHSAEHVAEEIRVYAPMVSPGCHLVIEDGIVRWMPHMTDVHGSPLDAIEQLLPGADFIRDEQTEAMFPVSMNPMGWWVRVAR